MRKPLLLVSTVSLFLLPAACKRGGSRVAPTPTPTAAMEMEGSSPNMEGSSPSSAHEESQPEASPTPLALDEAGMKKFIAHRREMVAFVTGEQKKLVEIADKKKGGDLATIKALSDVNAELEKGVAEIRAKHGYTEAQEREISDAVGEVLGAALTRNPMMASSIADLHKSELKGGDEGAAAKAALKQFEDQEKASLATARSRYGNAAVDVILSHYAELDALQKEAITAAFGANK